MGLLAGLFRLVHRSKIQAFAGIPGPQPVFPFGTALEFLGKKKPWEVCADYAQKYGPMTLIWNMGAPAVVLNDPELIGRVMIEDRDSYYKGAPDKALFPILSKHCLFVSNGEQWTFMRQNSPFEMPGIDKWLAAQVPLLIDFVAGKLRQLAARGDATELLPAIRRFSYDAFCRTVWGQELSDDSFDQFMMLASTGNRRMTSLLQFLPVLNPLFYGKRKRWYKTFHDLVAAAKSNPARGDDLLHVVLRHGTRLNDELLALSLSAPVFFGGTFPTAAIILTVLWLMVQHPDLAAPVIAEVREIKPRDLAALQTCRKLDAFLREAMRMWPTVPLYFRNVQKDKPATLGGHTIPPNTMIFITNWRLQRQSPHWAEATRFDPARWESGGAEANPSGNGFFFPFGRGPRTCVGEDFAWLYMKAALAAILAEFRVEIDPAAPYEQQYFFAVEAPGNLTGKIVRQG